MSVIDIKDWGVVENYAPYTAPELRSISLKGIALNHPSHTGEWECRTSRIVSTKGRLVTTYSGSVYKLGRISKEYRKYLADNDIEYNPANPITGPNLGVKE